MGCLWPLNENEFDTPAVNNQLLTEYHVHIFTDSIWFELKKKKKASHVTQWPGCHRWWWSLYNYVLNLNPPTQLNVTSRLHRFSFLYDLMMIIFLCCNWSCKSINDAKMIWLLVNNLMFVFFLFLFINLHFLFNGIDCSQMSWTKRESCVDVNVVMMMMMTMMMMMMMMNKNHVFFCHFFVVTFWGTHLRSWNLDFWCLCF